MKKLTYVLCGIFLFAGASTVRADVSVERYIKSGGFGGMGAFEGTTTEHIQGVKKSESSATKFTGSVLSRLAGGGEQIIITRIDKGVVWTLDPKKQTYAEAPIEPFRQGYPAEKEQAQEDKPRVRVTKAEFSIKKIGASETINGFPCKEYLLIWVIEMEDLETKAKMKNTMLTNLWTTPETAAMRKLQAEEAAFAESYMKKIGFHLSQSEMKQFGIEAFMATRGASAKDMEKEFARFKAEMTKLEGFPIRTVVNWQAQEQADPAVTQAEKSESMETPNLSGGLGGLIGGITGALAKKAIGKRKPGTQDSFFSSTTEIKSISNDAIAQSTFDIPAGYTEKN